MGFFVFICFQPLRLRKRFKITGNLQVCRLLWSHSQRKNSHTNFFSSQTNLYLRQPTNDLVEDRSFWSKLLLSHILGVVGHFWEPNFKLVSIEGTTTSHRFFYIRIRTTVIVFGLTLSRYVLDSVMALYSRVPGSIPEWGLRILCHFFLTFNSHPRFKWSIVKCHWRRQEGKQQCKDTSIVLNHVF